MAAALSILGASPGESARAGAQARPQARDDALLLVTVAINGGLRDGEYLVARRDGDYLLRADDLDRWRIRRPPVAPVAIEGEAFVPLSAIAGLAVTLDAAKQQLDLTIPPEAFAAQQLAGVPGRLRPTQGAFAAFLNYDLSLEESHGVRGAALMEGGISDDWGLVSGTMAVAQNRGRTRATRLDTYYLRDFPDHLLRLTIGDGVTDAPDWSRQMRFGGIRLGTEFALQPDLVTFPVPDFRGSAAVPSNVELFVNDALRYQADVGAGPFSIARAPLVTGAGEVTLVVRDALGVERRVRTSYYVSPRLLRRGLSAWSFEAGGERRGYGVESFDYRRPFVAGSYRHGLTDRLTVEGRAEASRRTRMAGTGVNFVWPALGEFGIAGAASQGADGTGTLYRLFFSRVTPRWNLSLRYQHGGRGFRELGAEEERARVSRMLLASAGVSLGRWGSAALSWTDLRYGDGTRTRLASANYSVSLAGRAYLNLFALRSRDNGRNRIQAGAGLSLALGRRESAYIQADSRNVSGEVQRTAPTQGGWGYRLAAGAGESDRQQAAVRWRGAMGDASVEAARFAGETAVRALAGGGLVLVGGGVRATRRIEGGIGVVEVPGQANVRIYRENQPILRTDENGRAIVPGLRPYEANRISLAPSDLPIDAQMADDRLTVVPRYRGAATARFAVAREHPATILATLPDGAPVPPGMDARADSGESGFTGHDGEIFLRDVRPAMVLTIDTPGGPCRVTLPDALPDAMLPRIGPLACIAAGSAGSVAP